MMEFIDKFTFCQGKFSFNYEKDSDVIITVIFMILTTKFVLIGLIDRNTKNVYKIYTFTCNNIII